MLKFKLNEILEGKTEERRKVGAADLDLGLPSATGFDVHFIFTRTPFMIEARFEVSGEVEVVCDRSLEPFLMDIEAAYTVLFKPGVEEDTDDEETALRNLVWSSNEIDLTREVRDTILLDIPTRKLHPRFLDADGNELPFEAPTEGEDRTDPRWAALAILKQHVSKN